MVKFNHFFLLIVSALALCLSGASDVEAQSYGNLKRIPFTLEYNNENTYKIISERFECIGSPKTGLFSSTKNAFRWSTTTLSWVEVEGSGGGECLPDDGKYWHSYNSNEIHGENGFYILAGSEGILPDGLYVKVVGGTGQSSSNINDYDYAFPYTIENGSTTIVTAPFIPNQQATSTYETRIVDVQYGAGTLAYAYRDDTVTPTTGTRKNLFDAFWKISNMEELGGSIADAQYYSIYYDDFQNGFLFGCYPITQLEGSASIDIPQGTSINNAWFVGYDDNVNCGDINYVNYESSVRIGDSFVIAGTSTVNAYAHWETDIDVLATYFINESEINTSVSARNPTLIAYQWARRPDGSLAGQGESIEPVQGFGTSTTEVSDLVDGTYDFLVKFSNVGCGIGASQCPFPLAYIYTTVEIDQGVVTVTGENEIFNNLNPPALSNEYEDCGLSNLSGCLNNTIRFMLIPSEESINGLLTVKEDLDRRIPFVYLAEITTVISEVFNSESTESLDMTLDLGFGEITIISREMIENVPFVGLLNLLLAGMLWLAFATGMYRRVLGIHNRETI